MKIWKLWTEENYAYYELKGEEDDWFDEFEWNGEVIEDWKPLNFYIREGHEKGINIYLVVLVTSKKKIELFKEEVDLSTIQLLPVNCEEDNEDGNLRLLNILAVNDALNEEKCELDYYESDGTVAGVEKYVFNEEAVKNLGLFKIKYSSTEIFATDKFKEIYEANGLRGLEFECVWDSEEEEKKGIKVENTSKVNGEEYIKHLETYLGKIKGVYKEKISLDLPIDILYIEGENFNSLVTNGMRNLNMNVPEGMEGYKNIELMTFIDKSYDISEEGLKKEENLWLINFIKNLALYPSRCNSWLGWGHTAANGANESPYYKGTKLCGAFVYPPTAQVDVKLYNFKNGNENAYIYNVMPIYKEEMDFIIENSGDDFFDLMGEEGIDQIIRKDRKNLCENM